MRSSTYESLTNGFIDFQINKANSYLFSKNPIETDVEISGLVKIHLRTAAQVMLSQATHPSLSLVMKLMKADQKSHAISIIDLVFIIAKCKFTSSWIAEHTEEFLHLYRGLVTFCSSPSAHFQTYLLQFTECSCRLPIMDTLFAWVFVFLQIKL